MKKVSSITIVAVIILLGLGSYSHKSGDMNCFDYNTKAMFMLGYYASSYDSIKSDFDSTKLDSALYYNNLAFNECSKSKSILTTRLTIFDLQRKYSNAIDVLNALYHADSVDHSQQLDIVFKKAAYFACMDSVKYRDSIKKSYAYFLDQPVEWSDSTMFQYKMGLLEYQLFGKDRAMKRLKPIENYGLLLYGIIINIEGGACYPLQALVNQANIFYPPLNDNRIRIGKWHWAVYSIKNKHKKGPATKLRNKQGGEKRDARYKRYK